MVQMLDKCDSCNGTGRDGLGGLCPICGGSGRTPPVPPAPTARGSGPGRRWPGGWIVTIALVIVFVAFALSRPQRPVTPAAPSPRPHEQPATAPAPLTPAVVPTAPPAKKTHAVTYAAFHRHALGGQCNGTVRLDAGTFRYDSSQHPINVTRQVVRRIDGPGFVDGDGKKWHFRFQGKTDDAVERLFQQWLEHGRVE
jgi:hypothetical protein